MIPPEQAAEGLLYGFKGIGVPPWKIGECALYACERIHGQFPEINQDGSKNEQWAYWLIAYNYLKEQFK